MILQRLHNVLTRNGWNHKKIIVAVSGGSDSMALAALLHMAGQSIAVAHCNFGLRGEESDGDEALVRSWCREKRIPCYVQYFDTRKSLEAEKGNLQERARTLRYQWFEALRVQTGFDLIATAHHMQDSAETLLINFFKGTGIAGLHGILPQQQQIIRPLLGFTKEELQQFAAKQHIPWREDSSNLKDDYTRNSIRQHLLPAIEKVFPQAVAQLAGNARRFREVELLYEESVSRYRKKLIEQRKNDWYIPVLKLRQVQPLHTIMWELIKPFGFHTAQLNDVVHLIEADTGRYVNAAGWRIIRNRDFLIITALRSEESTHILIEAGERRVAAPGFSISMKPEGLAPADLERIKKLESHEACLDSARLSFPLVLRPWKTGDYFYPLGMKKKKKKVSRFLIEQKVPLHEKEKVWVLESDKKIVWVVGRRIDERFCITKNTANCCYFSVKPQ